VRSSIRIFCRIPLRDRNRFSFSWRSTHRPTLQLYCAIIRERKGLLLGSWRENVESVVSLPRGFLPSWNPSSRKSTMQSWLNSLMVAYIVRAVRCTRQPRKVVGSSKVSPLASLGDAIISPSPTVIPCHVLKHVVQFCRFLHRLSCLLFSFGEIAILYIRCGKKFVAFFPLDITGKTPRTFFHT